MECKGKLLTDEQVDELSFMVHNYYNKDISIYLQDVERVLNSNTNEPSLLVIEVQDMNSVPSVTYKGKDIKGKVLINYEWTTDEFEKKGKHNMTIKHIYGHEKYVVGKTIQEEKFD